MVHYPHTYPYSIAYINPNAYPNLNQCPPQYQMPTPPMLVEQTFYNSFQHVDQDDDVNSDTTTNPTPKQQPNLRKQQKKDPKKGKENV